MTTLYRRYRPQLFSELVGQNHIKTTLIHEIEANKIAQDTIHNSRTENTIMIGYMLRLISLDKEDIEKVLRSYFSGKVLEANLKALEIGISLNVEET